MTELSFNPRWVNYARVHGRTPEDQLTHDRKAWPGGSMCGFILWGRAQIGTFGKAHPEAFTCGRLVDHESYDRWLDALPLESETAEGGPRP